MFDTASPAFAATSGGDLTASILAGGTRIAHGSFMVEVGNRTPRERPLLGLLAFVALTAGTAALGSLPTSRSVRSRWYATLRKPSFQPPSQAFGPVWTGLYALMAASAWRVWRAPASPQRTRALALWGTQLALNGAWTWLFFGARKPKAALAELATLFVMIGAYAREARKVDATAAWMMAPYLGWTAFAAVLNEEIVRRNA